MRVDWKDPGDRDRLRELIAVEREAKQRDRLRVVLLAGEGLGQEPELEREHIAAVVGRSRQFVDTWVGRYHLSAAAGTGRLAGDRSHCGGTPGRLQRPDPAGKDSPALRQAVFAQWYLCAPAPFGLQRPNAQRHASGHRSGGAGSL
jgi:hypothetical protein